MTAVTKIRTDEAALRKARMLIGGKWVDSASGEVLEVEDPAHRRPTACNHTATHLLHAALRERLGGWISAFGGAWKDAPKDLRSWSRSG